MIKLNTDDIETQITDILCEIGIPANVRGYCYLRDALMMSVEDPRIINSVNKKLYPEIAKAHDTTVQGVSDAIRYAIKAAWKRGDVDALNSYFRCNSYNRMGTPTNCEFLATICDKLVLVSRFEK